MSLVGQIPGALSQNIGGVPTLTDPNGWEILSLAGTAYSMHYEAEIDLAGLTIQEKTFFPAGAMIQGNQVFVTTGYTPGDIVTDTILVSTVPLTSDDIINASLGFVPGMTGFTGLATAGTNEGMDLQNILFCQHRTLTYSSVVAPYLSVVGLDYTGTNTGVASSRLWYYRICSLPFNTDQAMVIYPTAVVISGGIGEEKDLSRLMRQKRNTRLHE